MGAFAEVDEGEGVAAEFEGEREGECEEEGGGGGGFEELSLVIRRGEGVAEEPEGAVGRSFLFEIAKEVGGGVGEEDGEEEFRHPSSPQLRPRVMLSRARTDSSRARAPSAVSSK